jgi:hypothetical protein
MAPDSPSFTEERWLASADPSEMISVIFPKSTERQMRLFMVACCRQVERWMPEASRQAVKLMEQAADNLGEIQRIQAELPWTVTIVTPPRPANRSVSKWYSALSVQSLTHTPIGEALAVRVAQLAASAVAVEGLGWDNDPAWEQVLQATWMNQGRSFDDWDQQRLAAVYQVGPEELSQFPGWATERQAQAELLRHIVGNPFRPYPVPAFWPSTVVELAQAVYDSRGDHRVLSDAVEEAGHQELAEHFRGEEWHPKGCWGLDLILGKGR